MKLKTQKDILTLVQIKFQIRVYYKKLNKSIGLQMNTVYTRV